MDSALSFLITYYPTILVAGTAVTGCTVFLQNLLTIRKLQSDLKKAALEREKMELDLIESRAKEAARKSLITPATFADVEKWVLQREDSQVLNCEVPREEYQLKRKAKKGPWVVTILMLVPFLLFAFAFSAFLYFVRWELTVTIVVAIVGYLAYRFARTRKDELKAELTREKSLLWKIRVSL